MAQDIGATVPGAAEIPPRSSEVEHNIQAEAKAWGRLRLAAYALETALVQVLPEDDQGFTAAQCQVAINRAARETIRLGEAYKAIREVLPPVVLDRIEEIEAQEGRLGQ